MEPGSSNELAEADDTHRCLASRVRGLLGAEKALGYGNQASRTTEEAIRRPTVRHNIDSDCTCKS